MLLCGECYENIYTPSNVQSVNGCTDSKLRMRFIIFCWFEIFE
jgi:hypothetical protein